MNEVEARRLSEPYGRFYAPIAVVMLTLSFLPIFEDVVVKEEGVVVSTTRYGSLWELAAMDDGGPAAIGLILMAVFIGLLALASVRVTSAGPLFGVAVIAALMLLMLIAKPGTGDPTPDLAATGVAGGVLTLAAMALAGIHAAQLARRR